MTITTREQQLEAALRECRDWIAFVAIPSEGCVGMLDKIDTALALPVGEALKPVAWRYRYWNGNWLYQGHQPTDQVSASPFEVQPLYASLPSAELRALSEAATKGPWRGGHRCDGAIRATVAGERVSICRDLSTADTKFIVACVAYVRAMLGGEK